MGRNRDVYRGIPAEDSGSWEGYSISRLLLILQNLHQGFAGGARIEDLFQSFLDDIVRLTASEHGFFGEVLYSPANRPYISLHVYSGATGNVEIAQQHYAASQAGENAGPFDALYEAVLATRDVVNINPLQQEILHGTPPSVNSFIGLPILFDQDLVGLIGLANRQGGYTDDLAEELRLVLAGCAMVIQGYRTNIQRINILADLADEAARNQALLKTVPDAIITINERGLIESINPGGERLFGYRADQLIGRNVSCLMPEEEASQHDEYIRRYLTTGVRRLVGTTREVEYLGPNGTLRCGDLFIDELFVSGERKFIGVVRDITERKGAITALRVSEERLQLTLDAMEDAVLDWNLENGEIYLSRRWMSMLGNEPHESHVRLEDIVTLIHPDDRPGVLEKLQAHLRGESPMFEIEHRMRHRSGDWIWLLDRGKVVSRNERGEPLRMVGTHVDITERRRAQEALRTSQTHLAQAQALAHVGSWRWFADSGQMQWSDETYRILGYVPQEVLANLENFVSAMGDGAELLPELFQQVLAGGATLAREYTLLTGDAMVKTVFLKADTWRAADTGAVSLLGIIQDVTEQKKVGRMKKEFISVVSHELRTPLTSILGSLGLLSSGAVGGLHKDAESMVSIAKNNAQRLLELINDILDMEKIESGKMRFAFKEVDVDGFLRESIDAMQGYARQYNVLLQLMVREERLKVLADYNRLLQVMNNLLSNAVKFSEAGSMVTVTAAKVGAQVRISVSDRGRGIPEEFKEQIFDKFTQQDSSDKRHVGGTGLGLNIARAIVEAHGGSINFVSRSGLGTTFFIDIPRMALRDDASHLNTSADKRGRRVLVYLDDVVEGALLEMLLAQDGFSCDIVYTATSVRTLLSLNDYVALITNGYLAASLQGVKGKAIPWLLMVGKESQENSKDVHRDGLLIRRSEQFVDTVAQIARHLNCLVGRPNILQIDSDTENRRQIKQLFSNRAVLDQVGGAQEACGCVAARCYDLVVVGEHFSDGSVADFFRCTKNIRLPPVVLLTDEPIKESKELPVRVVIGDWSDPDRILSLLLAQISCTDHAA